MRERKDIGACPVPKGGVEVDGGRDRGTAAGMGRPLLRWVRPRPVPSLLTMFVTRWRDVRTMRNVRVISLRIITHYIPRYTARIVYYAAEEGKKVWDFCGPAVMGAVTRGIITMQPARIRVYIYTWQGISNCIVNNLGKLRVYNAG